MTNQECQTSAQRVAATLAVIAALLGLSACTYASQELDNVPGPSGPGAGSDAGAGTVFGQGQGFDITQVAAVPAIAELVPEHVKADGILTVGSELTYPPMEFVAGDGQTAIGLDIDIAKAIAQTMGLEAEIRSASFDSIIPGIGPKYEVGISAFTITPERLDAVNMVAYFSAGSQVAVRAGNPTNIDGNLIPFSVCGTRFAVQIGTVQQADLAAWNDNTCSDNPITILPYETQADATANLLGGKVDAMYADSPIIDYALLQTDGAIELLGELRDGANYGVVVAKDDEPLTLAVQTALQELMDTGTLQEISEFWGNAQGAITQTFLNPLSTCGNTVYNEPKRNN